jgi:quercetin dioxygenase-like cupin family protein
MTSRDGTHLTRGAVEPAANEIAFTPTWTHKDRIEGFSPVTGVVMQSVTGGKLMANWVTIQPDKVVPRHQHPHEQLGIMLEGELELTLGDETRLLGPGDAYTIPPHLPHSARTNEKGCVVLDIFTPPRDDYR